MAKEKKVDSLSIAKISIEKKYGNIMQTMGAKGALKLDSISSGSMSLDMALGRGGFVRGRLYEIYGPPSGGKTTLTMSVIAEAQKRGIRCCFVDAEHSADPKLFKAMGVNIDELDVIEGFVGDENLDALETILKTGEIGVAVVDSVAALIPRAEAESEIGNDHMALLARLMSKACRKFVPIASETNTLIIFINQVRTDLKAWGDNQITTGGNALDFYGTGRIKVTGGKHNNTRILDPITKEVIGHNTTFEITKNKLAPPFRKAEIPLIYGIGYDTVRELLKLGDQLGIIEKTGSWYRYKDSKAQGEENIVSLFRDNEVLLNELKNDVLVSTGLKDIYESDS